MDEFSGYHGVKAKVQLDRVLLSRNFDQERHSIVDRTSASGLVFRCENQTAWRRRFRSASAHQFCELFALEYSFGIIGWPFQALFRNVALAVDPG
jgi:hypothetical protein